MKLPFCGVSMQLVMLHVNICCLKKNSKVIKGVAGQSTKTREFHLQNVWFLLPKRSFIKHQTPKRIKGLKSWSWWGFRSTVSPKKLATKKITSSILDWDFPWNQACIFSEWISTIFISSIIISTIDGCPISFLPSYWGVPMVFLWFSYGFPMVFLWFSYGFPLVWGPPFKRLRRGRGSPSHWGIQTEATRSCWGLPPGAKNGPCASCWPCSRRCARCHGSCDPTPPFQPSRNSWGIWGDSTTKIWHIWCIYIYIWWMWLIEVKSANIFAAFSDLIWQYGDFSIWFYENFTL